jgi:hypothetical protein
MKKWMIAVAIVSMVSLFGFGVVMAQDTLPGNPVKPSCPNCPFGGPGYAGNQVLHEDMGSALADVLGISVEDFDAYRQDGKTFYEIAAELNLDLANLSDKLSEVRQEAIEAAFADGALTQDQYEFLMERAQSGNRFGGGMVGGMGAGSGGRHTSGNYGGNHGNSGFGAQDCLNSQSAPSN